MSNVQCKTRFGDEFRDTWWGAMCPWLCWRRGIPGTVIRCPSIGCLKCVKPTENKAQKKGTSNSTQTRYYGHEETTLVYLFWCFRFHGRWSMSTIGRQGLQAIDLSWPFQVWSQTILYLTCGSWSYLLIWVTPKKIDKYFCIVLLLDFTVLSLCLVTTTRLNAVAMARARASVHRLGDCLYSEKNFYPPHAATAGYAPKAPNWAGANVQSLAMKVSFLCGPRIGMRN